MAKSSFINKKTVIIMLTVLCLIGIGIGCYFLLKPKPDLKAPFSNTYTLLNDATYKEVKGHNDILEEYFANNLTENSEERTLIINQYELIEPVLGIYDSINEFLKDNLMYVEENKTLLKNQQNLTNTYKNIQLKLDECKEYFDTYLNKNIIKNYTTQLSILQKIQNYNSIYYSYVTELAMFYKNVGVIVNENLKTTIEANRLTKLNVLVITTWANELMKEITNMKMENVADIHLSLSQLKSCTLRYVGYSTYEYYNNKDTYDEILDCFDVVNFEECIYNIANNAFDEYKNSQEDENIKTCLIKIGSYLLG